MDNPHPLPSTFLSSPGGSGSRFCSVDLYRPSLRAKSEGAACSFFHLENESGAGEITVYPVFPGVELVCNELHMEHCSKLQPPR